MLAQSQRGNAPQHDARFAFSAVEAGRREQNALVRHVGQREQRIDGAELEIPFSDALIAMTEAERAVRHDRLCAGAVEDDRLPLSVLGRVAKIASS
jgi:hypothetical protein